MSFSDNAFTQHAPDLQALATLSQAQAVTFTQYTRYVLPLDGFVFWLRTQQTTFSGSIHRSADQHQDEDATFALNRVIFTSGTEIQPFNEVGPDTIWIGEIGGVKFAFSRQDYFYRTAGLFHYAGDAVYPSMLSQLVDVGSQLPATALVVSNSLPAWLALKSYTPIWLAPLNPGITLYPSYAVPDNLPPPYGAVHIFPEATRAIQAAPALGPLTTHRQLASDRVRVTLYGCPNNQALDFLDLVDRYSFDTDVIGMMNMPIVRDEKHTQRELGILAMQKTIEFEVSYNQTRINDIARQLVKSASATIFPTY